MKNALKVTTNALVVTATVAKICSFVKTHSRFQRPFNEKDAKYGLLGDLVEAWKDRYFNFAWSSGYDEGFACGISASPEDVEEFYKGFEAREEAELASHQEVA